jgi:hypothetical protein
MHSDKFKGRGLIPYGQVEIRARAQRVSHPTADVCVSQNDT